ncbi:MAG TPA: hypothetical protein VNN12_05425 [Dehalococcoidia bacterium]|nr:hypothetical protein [Dehalococcoidia bacterium]
MKRVVLALVISLLWHAPWELELQLDGSELAGWDLVWVVQEGRVLGGAIVSPGPITLRVTPQGNAPLEMMVERYHTTCSALTCTATLEATQSAGTIAVPAPRYYAVLPFVASPPPPSSPGSD